MMDALLTSDLYRAWRWLEDNRQARMTDKAKLAHLLVEHGGSYKRGDADVLRIAGVRVSCTGGTHNLLNAWRAKAHIKLNGGQS